MRKHIFSNREQASDAAASKLAAALANELEAAERASLVVSGGTTPKACLNALRQIDIPWHRIQVSMTDERCVAATHVASNERMVRAELLAERAVSAEFHGLSEVAVASLVKPFAAVLIGMGEDGHVASIFPDMRNREEALSLNQCCKLLPAQTAASPHARITMSLGTLCQTRVVVLLAFGQAKLDRLEVPNGSPVGALMQQRSAPVEVIWAP